MSYKFNVFTGTLDIAADTTIGTPVIGGVPNEVLFIGPTGLLAQDPHFTFISNPNNALTVPVVDGTANQYGDILVTSNSYLTNTIQLFTFTHALGKYDVLVPPTYLDPSGQSPASVSSGGSASDMATALATAGGIQQITNVSVSGTLTAETSRTMAFITGNGGYSNAPGIFFYDTNDDYKSNFYTPTGAVTYRGIVLTPAGMIYVASQDNASVYVIDPLNNNETTFNNQLSVGSEPQGLGINSAGTKIYCCNVTDGSVSIIDPSGPTVTGTVSSLEAAANPRNVAFEPGISKAYVTDTANDKVLIINTATNSQYNSTDLSGSGSFPWGVAFTPSGSKAYVCMNQSGLIVVMETGLDTITGTITVGNEPLFVAFTPNGAKAYVTNHADATVSIIDVATDTVTATVSVGGNPNGVKVSPDGLYAYVVCSDTITGHVYIIDTTTDAVTSSVATSNGMYDLAIGSGFTTHSGVYTTRFVGAMRNYDVSVINTTVNAGTALVISLDTQGGTSQGRVYLNGWGTYIENSLNGNNRIVSSCLRLDQPNPTGGLAIDILNGGQIQAPQSKTELATLTLDSNNDGDGHCIWAVSRPLNNKGFIQLGQDELGSSSSGGAWIGCNANLIFDTADFLHYEKNSTTLFNVDVDGNTTLTNNLTLKATSPSAGKVWTAQDSNGLGAWIDPNFTTHGTYAFLGTNTQTIACPFVTSDKLVFVTGRTTTGFLGVNNIIDGVSFDVVSSDAGEVGFFYWEVKKSAAYGKGTLAAGLASIITKAANISTSFLTVSPITTNANSGFLTASASNGSFGVASSNGADNNNFSYVLNSNEDIAIDTLVAGTVTVACPNVKTNSLILITANSVDANSGFLSVTNIVDGVSFDIVSSNAADDNLVAWRIVPDELPLGLTASRAVVTDSLKRLSSSATTATEIGYVNGVTSAIQTQLDAKKTIATGNNYKWETTSSGGNLQETTVTASRAVASDANGLPVASSTTATELGYVNGVTSAIQTQLDTKLGVKANDRATGQTAAKSLIAVTVGGSDTSYLVSANVNVTTSTLFSFGLTCTYTDETNTSRVLNLSFSNLAGTFLQTITQVLGAGAYEGIPLHIRAKASTTITIASAGTFTTVTYNLEERIVQL